LSDIQFRALYWWIDRWRKSTAYMDMTLEEQGAYRNLLDEATLRGGHIPDNEKVLAKASGDPARWRRVRKTVMRRFVRRSDGWHHETLDEVLSQMTRRMLNQRAYRGRRASDNEPVTEPITRRSPNGHQSDNDPDNKPDKQKQKQKEIN